MPRKATAPKSTKNVETKSEKPVKESKSKSTKAAPKAAKPVTKPVTKAAPKAKTQKSVTVEEPVVEVPPVSDVEDDVDDGETPTKKSRHVPTKDSIVEGFDELVSVIDDEIKRLRENTGKAKGVKFLRTLGKRVKTLRGYSVRVMKQKQKTNRKNNTNSGFLKPVQISKDMAKFTGWNPDDLRSRVDVTKYICKYIRDNNLQNPEDRRQIVADKKLSKLLEYDSASDDKPLTYYRIQTYMKKHFTNPPKEVVTTA